MICPLKTFQEQRGLHPQKNAAGKSQLKTASTKKYIPYHLTSRAWLCLSCPLFKQQGGPDVVITNAVGISSICVTNPFQVSVKSSLLLNLGCYLMILS